MPVHRLSRLQLSGSITALATPFTVAGEIDLDAWQLLLQRQLAGGSSGVVVAGSTGEAATLYEAEYDCLLRTAVEIAGGRMIVLAGTGLSGTARTIELTRRVAALGADAALVVAPPYVRPTQAGIEAHYLSIADDAGLPVVLYNVPSRTGCDVLPETVARLATHERIIGIKEACNDAVRMDALLALASPDFAVLSGDDGTAARAMLAGANGVVSVASNVVPAAFTRLCALARSGDRDSTEALDAEMHALYSFLSIEPNPIPLKALLAQQGFGRGVRLPLTPLSAEHAVQESRAAELAERLELSCRDMHAV